MRFCKECGFDRPESDFYPSDIRGHSYLCREHKKKYVDAYKKKTWAEGTAAWVISAKEKNRLRYDPDKQANNRLKRAYRISLTEYNMMLGCQNNVCKICGKTTDDKRLTVDHNHKTGYVRGILCSNCNRGLGLFCDNPELLRKAANYLEESSDVDTLYTTQ